MVKRTGVSFAAALFCVSTLAVLASCRKQVKDGARLTSYSQQIASAVKDFTVKAGETYNLNIKVTNTGAEAWFGGGVVGRVDASYRWYDAKGKLLPLEGARAPLNRLHVPPGESDELLLPVNAPGAAGDYTLWVSMVQEGYDWFFARGAQPLVLKVAVR